MEIKQRIKNIKIDKQTSTLSRLIVNYELTIKIRMKKEEELGKCTDIDIKMKAKQNNKNRLSKYYKPSTTNIKVRIHAYLPKGSIYNQKNVHSKDTFCKTSTGKITRLTRIRVLITTKGQFTT